MGKTFYSRGASQHPGLCMGICELLVEPDKMLGGGEGVELASRSGRREEGVILTSHFLLQKLES